jgi:hypothetical protein
MVTKAEMLSYQDAFTTNGTLIGKSSLFHATLWSAFFAVAVVIGLLN